MSAWSPRPPEELPAWRRLGKLAERPLDWSGDRFAEFSARLGPLLVDYSKQRIDAEVSAALLDFAEASGLTQAIRDFCDGAVVNRTENRPARHMSLRSAGAAGPFLDLAEAVRDGRWLGRTGKPVRAVVHVGIGGSHLGPELACGALAPTPALDIRFLANVDGSAVDAALRCLDPTETLAIIASKSFSTLETRVNAEALRDWFGHPNALERHFLAVTANEAAAREFGVPAANVLSVDDAVGGRYSLMSAVGLPIAIAIGRAGFESFLEGARMVDRHFETAPLGRNIPAILALLQVWNTNFRGAASHAVLPYDHRLRLLPDYLQQLEMESNGKSVREDGEPARTHTAPIVWGGEETGGQHAFHQLLHQGTRAFSADCIACIRPDHDRPEHHAWLLANCLAQSQALMEGRGLDELPDEPLSRHRELRGGHPTTTILLDALTPQSLGALLALYEHKTFAAAVLWQINPFDQWGVELGKELAPPIHAKLTGAQSAGQAPLDFSTAGLLREIERRR